MFAVTLLNHYSFGVNLLHKISLAVIALGLASCAAPFRDDSHYVALGSNRGYYVLEKGSPLALRLGYTYPPTSDSGDPLHRGYGTDVVAFRFNRAGVLIAPPAYFSQLRPDTDVTRRLAILKKGVSTWPEIRHIFGHPNWPIKQPDGGLLVYHEISIYNPLEQDVSSGGSR
jgi:hypothetical protein